MKTKLFNLVLALLMGLFAFSPLFYSSVFHVSKASAAISCSGSSGGVQLHKDSNGLCLPDNGSATPTTASVLILRAINILLGIATAVAVLFIVWGGFQYIFSGGNQETAEAGQKTVVNSLIGLVIIALAFMIVIIVNHTVSGCIGFGIGC